MNARIYTGVIFKNSLKIKRAFRALGQCKLKKNSKHHVKLPKCLSGNSQKNFSISQTFSKHLEKLSKYLLVLF